MSLDRLASLAMIAASAVLVYVALKEDAVPPVTPPGLYEVGDRIDTFPNQGVPDDGPALVIFVSSACRFCTASMGFYRRVVDAANVPVVVWSFDQPATLNEYLAEHDLAPDSRATVRAEHVKLPITPVVLLVAGDRRVERVWPGRLSDAYESEVLRAVER
jgi:hypothetical protein